MHKFFSLSIVGAWVFLGHAISTPCDLYAMDYGDVCRCTSTSCDTIEPVGNLSDSDVAIYSTSMDGDRLTRSTATFSSESNGGWQHISFNTSTTFQEMVGFGGAITDAVALDLLAMTTTTQQQILDQYYSENGIQYSVGRVPIASCDFSTSVYSYCDVEGDLELANFSIDVDSDEAVTGGKLQLIQRIIAMSSRALWLFASPWAPPAWMTTTNSTIGNPKLSGEAGDATHKSWALYFSKFLTAYKDQGITFSGVTAQNEPMGNTGAWQDLKFTAEEQRDFIKSDLGPRLRADHPTVKLMMLDDQRSHVVDWTAVVLGDEEAAGYIDGVGVHWYAAVEDRRNLFGELTQTHDAFPDHFIMATEACEGYLPWSKGPHMGDYTRGETYGHDILNDINNWAVGWTDWNILLDMSGGPNWAENVVDAPIIADTEDGEVFYKQPMFYYLGHFSKFVPPGSHRIEVGSEAPLLSAPMEATGFLTPDNQVVLVVLNRDIAGHKYYVEVPGRGFVNMDVPKHSAVTMIFNNA